MFDVVAFMLLGILLGTFTGLTPGIHVNMVAVFLLALAGSLAPQHLAVAIIAMAIAHTVWDFVPSVFLGAPEADTALSVLPGHRMLLEGRGPEAVYLTAIGGLGTMALCAASLLIIMPLLTFSYSAVHAYIHYLLLGMAAFMLLSERAKLKFFTCFLLSGLLGFVVLNYPPLPSATLLFPVFTGLFGMSTLIISMGNKASVPAQQAGMQPVGRRLVASGTLKALFSGMVMGTLPGIGSSQAAVLAHQLSGKSDNREFLVSIGGINTAVSFFSLVSLYTISRPRSGAAVAVQALLPGFGPGDLLTMVAVALFATGVSVFLLLRLLGWVAGAIVRIDYRKLTLSIVAALVLLTLILAGPVGILVLAVSTSIGLLAPLWDVKRTALMGVLMLPLVLFYAGV